MLGEPSRSFQDYSNGFLGMDGLIKRSLEKKSLSEETADEETFRSIINSIRARYSVETVEEYLEHREVGSPGRAELEGDMKRSPERVAALDHVVEILNTTDDVGEFKHALNEAYRLSSASYNSPDHYLPFPHTA